VLENGDSEVALFSRDIGKFREGKQFDVDMPADLDQFRRNNSH